MCDAASRDDAMLHVHVKVKYVGQMSGAKVAFCSKICDVASEMIEGWMCILY